MDKDFYQVFLPLAVVTFIGTWMVAGYFIAPLSFTNSAQDTVNGFAAIIAPAAYGLGTALLCLNHGRRIYKRQKAPFWGFSLLFFAGFLIILGWGLIEGQNGPNFTWFYDYTLAPAEQALYSTTAFYVTTAGYRVFRFRNLDAAVLLIAGTLVMWSVSPLIVGQIPIFAPIGAWISNVPAVAGYRAFSVGVALGIVGLGLRIFLHKHKEVLG
jgi:hypothetical protein